MNKEFDRRKFLATVGFGAAALTVGTAANAQTKLQLQRAEVLKIDPKMLELKLADPRAVEVLQLTKRLPETTPITKMGLTEKAVSILTPGAQKLTKADLQALAVGKVPEAAKALTVADIDSVKVAFGTGYRGAADLAALDVSCCCCTPCCCAAADHDHGHARAA